MDAPTASDLRAWAPPQFDWAAAGYPAPAGTDPDRLEKRVEWSMGEVLAITGRTLESITSMADVAIAEKAIVLKTIVDVSGGTKAALAVMQAPWLRSFTAGSYSETRFSPAEMSGIQGRGSEAIGSLGPEPLATLLLMLMTPDKRADWLYLIANRSAPAGTFIDPGFGCELGVGPGIFGPGVENGWPYGW